MLIPEGDIAYFRVMMSQWLKWAPPNHSWPTIEALAIALRSSGHEDMYVCASRRMSHLLASLPGVHDQSVSV